MRLRLVLALAGVLTAYSLPVQAGPYTDDMAKCIVGATTSRDKTMLVKWIFANIAADPDVAELAKVSPQQRNALDTQAAHLFERLLLETCHDQSAAALKYEGPESFQVAFRLLGQVSMRELMTDPQVSAALKEFAQHLDKKKFAQFRQGIEGAQ